MAAGASGAGAAAAGGSGALIGAATEAEPVAQVLQGAAEVVPQLEHPPQAGASQLGALLQLEQLLQVGAAQLGALLQLLQAGAAQLGA